MKVVPLTRPFLRLLELLIPDCDPSSQIFTTPGQQATIGRKCYRINCNTVPPQSI